MKLRQFVFALSLAFVVSTLSPGDAGAYPPRYYGGGGWYGGGYPHGGAGLMGWPYGAPGVGYIPYQIPYVAPYPYYGILPPPAYGFPWASPASGFPGSSQAGYDPSGTRQKTAEDYGYSREQFDQEPRKRPGMFPAVPFQAPKQLDRQAEGRRARIEVTVPSADAVVLIDGAMTSQGGIDRVYVTPPLDEDRLYSTVIEVRWTDASGKAQSQKESYDFIAGETIRYPLKKKL